MRARRPTLGLARAAVATVRRGRRRGRRRGPPPPSLVVDLSSGLAKEEGPRGWRRGGRRQPPHEGFVRRDAVGEQALSDGSHRALPRSQKKKKKKTLRDAPLRLVRATGGDDGKGQAGSALLLWRARRAPRRRTGTRRPWPGSGAAPANALEAAASTMPGLESPASPRFKGVAGGGGGGGAGVGDDQGGRLSRGGCCPRGMRRRSLRGAGGHGWSPEREGGETRRREEKGARASKQQQRRRTGHSGPQRGIWTPCRSQQRAWRSRPRR